MLGWNCFHIMTTLGEMNMQYTKLKWITGTSLALTLLAPNVHSAKAAETDLVNLRILETTDIHVNLANYDYYQDAETDKYGLVKTASLIKQARTEAKNSLLFDNGDLIQGNPLGDYVAKIDPLQPGKPIQYTKP